MALTILLAAVSASASQGSEWNSAGGDRANTRSQPSEKTLTTANVSQLTTKWVFTTGGDVSATPAVDGNTVYFPDWAGNLYALDKATGAQKWASSISGATSVPFDKARA